MPNWCESILKITGPKDEIASIAATGLDFEKILPTPADLIPDTYDTLGIPEFQKQANLAIYGYKSWYMWRVDNWGTKWTAADKELSMSDPQTIHVIMNTAWSLPVELLLKLSQDHPNTTIQIVDCIEEAGFFAGDAKIQNGEIIEDNIHTPTKKELLDRGMLCVEDKEELC